MFEHGACGSGGNLRKTRAFPARVFQYHVNKIFHAAQYRKARARSTGFAFIAFIGFDNAGNQRVAHHIF